MRISQLAVAILREAGVQPREYEKQAAALLRWVQDPENVYYINEPKERLQDPLYTIDKKLGDCFAEDTLVLREDMELMPIQKVRVGERIWGKNRWSEVVNTWEKGKLPITEIGLNNGSVLRLTEGHKVYVRSCCGPKKGEKMANGKTCSRDHGPLCATRSSRHVCLKSYGTEEIRIPVSDLREGMEIVQPEKIDRGDNEYGEVEQSWLIGAYIAEGWVEERRMMLSGKDGHWKEATKERGKAFAEERGWPTRWHEKYLAINSREAAALVGECGKGALNKRIPAWQLSAGSLVGLDDGLKLDASQNSRGEGWTFGTISRTLAVQYRVLQRMLGRSTSMRMVTNHGGYGSNPIYRIGVRVPGPMADKRLRVATIHRNVDEVPCYDIATDDHYVYLPEADCTVSNCDDQVILLCSLFESIRLSWKLCLAGKYKPPGAEEAKKIVYIEGNPVPPHCGWSHVFCMVATPPFKPKRWYFCETTVNGVPLGWDVIHGDKKYLPAGLPEMQDRYKGAPTIEGSLRDVDLGQASALLPLAIGIGVAEGVEMSGSGPIKDEEGEGGVLANIDWGKVRLGIFTGVVTAVGTTLALQWLNGEGMWRGYGSAPVRWGLWEAPEDK